MNVQCVVFVQCIMQSTSYNNVKSSLLLQEAPAAMLKTTTKDNSRIVFYLLYLLNFN